MRGRAETGAVRGKGKPKRNKYITDRYRRVFFHVVSDLRIEGSYNELPREGLSKAVLTSLRIKAA